MRKTKIICTLGPATQQTDVLRQLIQKGADVFRLNMSHADHGWVREVVPCIRTLKKLADPWGFCSIRRGQPFAQETWKPLSI
jgi:pyruvate kinase